MVGTENHILIVDDEAAIRNTLTDHFEEKNWVVHTASDGMQAIRSVRDFSPDIILMDIRMPGRDGIATCDIIRKDITLNHDVPVIMMTAFNDKSQIIKSIEAGCNDFILKPFQFDVLLEKIEKLIDTHNQGTQGKEKKLPD